MISHENVICNTGAFIKVTKVSKPTHRHSNIFSWFISLKPFQTIITQRLSSGSPSGCQQTVRNHVTSFFMYSFKDARNEHQR